MEERKWEDCGFKSHTPAEALHCQEKAGMLDWLVPVVCGLLFLFLVSSIPHWHYHLKVVTI